jgi:hypothetical protein
LSFVLAQGHAHVFERPNDEPQMLVRTQAEKHLGAAKEGWFWDRWLREYYTARVPVEVGVERLIRRADLRCAGPPDVLGEPLPADPPPPQNTPANGTGPRIDVARAARRLRKTSHVLLGYAAADGFPMIMPVEIGQEGPEGLHLTAAAPLPAGGRRAGLLGHSYQPQLIGLETRQHTGWLEVEASGEAIYAPHTETGYKAPANKTLLLLLNGLLAKRGIRAARRKS